MNNPDLVREYVENLAYELGQFRGMLALVLKKNDGLVAVPKEGLTVTEPFEVVIKQLEDGGLEIKLLEGKEEIEAVLGKPSPIIVPR